MLPLRDAKLESYKYMESDVLFSVPVIGKPASSQFKS